MDRTKVMLAGPPGNMATRMGLAILGQEDMDLCAYALAESSGHLDQEMKPTEGMYRVVLVPPERHEEILRAAAPDVVVDFTQPRSVNEMVRLYCRCAIKSVVGTTGGDRELLVRTVHDSSVAAVIATNMAPPIVMMREMLQFAATKFHGALAGFDLSIAESHQAAKPDPSGTAIDFLKFFVGLGVLPFTKEQIVMIRDPEIQKKLGVPDEYLGGHGFHTYTLNSPDGTVALQFRHNVLGRSVYVGGALRAIRFIAKQNGVVGKVYDMADVLRGS